LTRRNNEGQISHFPFPISHSESTRFILLTLITRLTVELDISNVNAMTVCVQEAPGARHHDHFHQSKIHQISFKPNKFLRKQLLFR
jgi:hypothetical protein